MAERPCRSCGTVITWAETERGNWMPLEEDPAGPWWILDGFRLRPWTEEAIMKQRIDLLDPANGWVTKRYVVHWERCPEGVRKRHRQVTH